MRSELAQKFHDSGYCIVGNILSGERLTEFVSEFDRDKREHPYFWRLLGGFEQTIACDALVSSPKFDGLVRHPAVLPLIAELFGMPPALEEFTLRYMPPLKTASGPGWHRDCKHREGHPLRLEYLQLMIYLTDVNDSTHCFSISPESADQPVLETDQQLERGGKIDIHGEAGTAVLFNSSCLHTATLRESKLERKSVQIYYGDPSRPNLSHYSAVPARLWHDHADPTVRAVYGKLNARTRLFDSAFGPAR